jgi:hypothetical protein
MERESIDNSCQGLVIGEKRRAIEGGSERRKQTLYT